MSKVVAIVGSPRKNGNVSSILVEMLRGASEQGAQTKVYHLNDMDIKGCHLLQGTPCLLHKGRYAGHL